MIRFALDSVSAADLEQRTIEGVLVPYGETASIGGDRYRFNPGSLTAARARTPLLVDHDRGRPIGVLAELTDTPDAALGKFKIDPTPAGLEALAQAATGSRGALSVGAELDEFHEGADGALVITAGRVLEVSLLALGAFAGATVTSVAAELAEPDDVDDDDVDDEPPPPSPDQLVIEQPSPAPPARQQEEPPMTEASAAAPMILTAAAGRPARELAAGELVPLLIRAQRGEPDALRYLEAALVESISTDVSGLLPPQYETNVLGDREVTRPLYNTFRGRPLPGVGLQVFKPKWTTHTAGAEAATVDADATSTKVVIGSQSATVKRWDWAGAIPWVVVERSDPSAIDAIYADAVQGFYLYVESKIAGQLNTAAVGTSTKMGAGIAEFYVATGNTRAPEVIVMAPDVWGKYADAGALNVALLQGSTTAGDRELTTTFAGIPAVVSGTLPAGTVVMATRRAIDVRVTEPVRLTANAIGALNVELAVVGESLYDTDYPAELLKFGGIVPTAADAERTTGRRG